MECTVRPHDCIRILILIQRSWIQLVKGLPHLGRGPLPPHSRLPTPLGLCQSVPAAGSIPLWLIQSGRLAAFREQLRTA